MRGALQSTRYWEPTPQEAEDNIELALMGHQWAEDDENPLEQFVHKLHGMFLAVLPARSEMEDEVGLLFPVERRKAQQEGHPWYQLQFPGPKAYPMHISPIGPLPRDWKWGADFLPALLRWLTKLMWRPLDEGPPQGHCQVSFMELALHFESHAGRPLPPTPQARFKGTELSVQEKGRVRRLAVTLLGRTLGKESILPAPITTRCRSLVPLGAGT